MVFIMFSLFQSLYCCDDPPPKAHMKASSAHLSPLTHLPAALAPLAAQGTLSEGQVCRNRRGFDETGTGCRSGLPRSKRQPPHQLSLFPPNVFTPTTAFTFGINLESINCEYGSSGDVTSDKSTSSAMERRQTLGTKGWFGLHHHDHRSRSQRGTPVGADCSRPRPLRPHPQPQAPVQVICQFLFNPASTHFPQHSSAEVKDSSHMQPAARSTSGAWTRRTRA